MNTNTDLQSINPRRVAALLTRAAEQLDGDTVTALKRARDTALERQIPGKPVFVLSTGRHTHWLASHSAHQWVAVTVLFMAVLVGYAGYWQHEKERDISRTDVAILTDDLPLEVFVDH